jgi:hypothetical protein
MFVVLMADHGPRRWRPYYSGILLRRFAESVNAIRLSFVGLAAQAERIAVEMDRGGWESKDA